MIARGTNGEITVEGGWITIGRYTLGKLGRTGRTRRIPISAITSVQYRPAGRITQGFIRFMIPGIVELPTTSFIHMYEDEHAVMFTRHAAAEFDAVRATIEDRIARGTTTGPDISGQLAELAELYRAGALNDAEYAAAKARIIRS